MHEERKDLALADKTLAVEKLLQFIIACPHIMKAEIGAEALADDLIKATSKLAEYFDRR